MAVYLLAAVILSLVAIALTWHLGTGDRSALPVTGNAPGALNQCCVGQTSVRFYFDAPTQFAEEIARDLKVVFRSVTSYKRMPITKQSLPPRYRGIVDGAFVWIGHDGHLAWQLDLMRQRLDEASAIAGMLFLSGSVTDKDGELALLLRSELIDAYEQELAAMSLRSAEIERRDRLLALLRAWTPEDVEAMSDDVLEAVFHRSLGGVPRSAARGIAMSEIGESSVWDCFWNLRDVEPAALRERLSGLEAVCALRLWDPKTGRRVPGVMIVYDGNQWKVLT
ncbi:MAG: hypothetical protein AAF628_27745 [Planctomycetota bacterium]